MTHCCRFARSDVLKVDKVLSNPVIEEPFGVDAGRNLEEVLVQGTSPAAPNDNFEAPRPRKQDITIMNNIFGGHVETSLVRSFRVALPELGNCDDGQVPVAFGRVFLKRQPI